MGTRSRIAIQNQDGTLNSIYCHWDGYPSHNGAILEKSYREEAKVRELISLGSLSVLASKISAEGNTRHSFDSPQGDVCVFYGRDRGEKEVGPATHGSLDELVECANDSWGEYVYIFNPETSGWSYIDMHSSPKRAVTLEAS